MQELSTIKTAMAALLEVNQIVIVNGNSELLYAGQTPSQVQVIFDIGNGFISIKGRKYTRLDAFNLGELLIGWSNTLSNMGYNVRSVEYQYVSVGLAIVAKLNKS